MIAAFPSSRCSIRLIVFPINTASTCRAGSHAAGRVARAASRAARHASHEPLLSWKLRSRVRAGQGWAMALFDFESCIM